MVSSRRYDIRLCHCRCRLTAVGSRICYLAAVLKPSRYQSVLQHFFCFRTPDTSASDAKPGYHHLKNRPTMFPAIVLANPPPPNAPLVRLEAWLNLSHLEKATVFVSVRTRAITAATLAFRPCFCTDWLAYNDQPYDILQSHKRQHCQTDPQSRRDVHAEPEEALVCCIYVSYIRVRRFKNPVTVSRGGVDFVPPS